MPRKAKTVNPYLVFVSHSAKDRWIAGQMSGQIEAKGRKCGIKTFLDEKDIQGGDPISESIRKSLQSCAEFVVLLTRNSLNRPWVLIEIGAAWVQEKHVVAIIDQVLPSEMPDVIAPYKAIDLNNFDAYVEQLINRAKKTKKRV